MTGAIKKKKQKPLCQTQLTCSVTTKKKKKEKRSRLFRYSIFILYINNRVFEEFSKFVEFEHLSSIFARFSSATSEANLSGG